MNRRLTFILSSAAAIVYLWVGRYMPPAASSAFKVLPLLIISAALLLTLRKEQGDKTALRLCMAALFFSMAGDVSGEFKGSGLMKNAFVLQIALFAVAQLIYAVSFVRYFRRNGGGVRCFAGYAVCVLLIVYMIWFGLRVLSFIEDSSLKIAVPIYVFLIGMMGLTSALQCRKYKWWFVAGALLFICSDSILAYRTFIGPVPQAGWLIMSTYYAAQMSLNLPLIHKSIIFMGQKKTDAEN